MCATGSSGGEEKFVHSWAGRGEEEYCAYVVSSEEDDGPDHAELDFLQDQWCSRK